MKLPSLPVAGLIMSAVCLPLSAGEKTTLMATSAASGFTDSAPITLAQGDSMELIYASPVSTGFYFVVVIGGKELAMTARVTPASGADQVANPIKIAGPAVIKARIGPSSVPLTGLMTVDVTRAGTASSAAAIPQEPGTTWQVILESSSDLVNWTAVNPGDYSADTPQRYFRTRMVKRS